MNDMNHPKPPDILPEPPMELKQHSDKLVSRIISRVDSGGPISFADYMEMALYEPGLGYYSAGLHKFGAAGDFVTAPELGDVFAACLAKQVAEVADHLEACDILEIGAGSGKLAAQLFSVGTTENCAYRILERSADLRAVQQQTIESEAPDHADRVRWLDQPPSEPWQGVIIANEVVDALPVERFCIRGETVRQVCVSHHEGRLTLSERQAPPELEAAVRALGELPDGYCSDIQPQLAPWLESVTAGLERGVALLIDYGYPRHEYYRPERSDGTLIAHYRHRAHDEVLWYPGLQDLTAFVDFTALAAAGRAVGLELLGYTSQALFLMSCGLDQVVQDRLSGDAERDMALNNQVRQLMLPGMMGEKFQVMALGRGWPGEAPLRGFTFRDLRNRL
ncbi:MAG: SAM-dependent methyltransferase [Xanthomonadales bacterium]|nr:SAM-dependent methyltransferase [Xanthomonadales bacterium]